MHNGAITILELLSSSPPKFKQIALELALTVAHNDPAALEELAATGLIPVLLRHIDREPSKDAGMGLRMLAL